MRHARKIAAEALGTMLLLAAVVGSGIMGEQLSGGNVAIALLANSVPNPSIGVLMTPLKHRRFASWLYFARCVKSAADSTFFCYPTAVYKTVHCPLFLRGLDRSSQQQLVARPILNRFLQVPTFVTGYS
jgi:hypothetical protein